MSPSCAPAVKILGISVQILHGQGHYAYIGQRVIKAILRARDLSLINTDIYPYRQMDVCRSVRHSRLGSGARPHRRPFWTNLLALFVAATTVTISHEAKSQIYQYNLSGDFDTDEGPAQSSSDNATFSGYVRWNTNGSLDPDLGSWHSWDITVTKLFDAGDGNGNVLRNVFRFVSNPADYPGTVFSYPPSGGATVAPATASGCFRTPLGQGNAIPDNSDVTFTAAGGTSCQGTFQGIGDNPLEPPPSPIPTGIAFSNGINYFSVYQTQGYIDPGFKQGTNFTTHYLRIPFIVSAINPADDPTAPYAPILASATETSNNNTFLGWNSQTGGLPGPKCDSIEGSNATGVYCPFGVNQNIISQLPANTAQDIDPPEEYVPAPLPLTGLLPVGVALRKLSEKRKTLIETESETTC